jgi:hypothetical protein
VIPTRFKSDNLEGRSRYSDHMPSPESAQGRPSSKRAFIGVGIFFYFAMTMALYAAITLLYPGTALDKLWSLNPDAHRQLLLFRKVAGFGFIILAAVAAIAGIGWFRRRLWGWQIAVFGMSVQILGDCVNLVRGDLLRGGSGLLIATGLLAYLLTDKVRKNFIPGENRAIADQTDAR